MKEPKYIDRNIRIIQHYCDGLTRKQVVDRENITVPVQNKMICNMMKFYEVQSTPELIATLFRNQLLK